MADNVDFQSGTLATPASGTKVSTDEDAVNGQVQRIKIAVSADGSSTHVTATANGLSVVTSSTVIDLTLSLDTSQYADGDVLAAAQELASAVRASGGTGVIQSIQVIDQDDQGQALDVVISDSTITLGTENDPVSISDADAAKILGIVEVAATDYIDLVASQYVNKSNLGIVIMPDATSLFISAISRGTGTYTASGIVLRIGIIQD